MLKGTMLIGARDVLGAGAAVHGRNPATGEALEPVYPDGSTADIDAAVGLALEAFGAYRRSSPEARGRFLDAVAGQIAALGDALIERAMLETGLPRARLEGERARTVNQLRMFATDARAGGWLGARIDHAQPERKPAPRSDLRAQYIPIGPVAVFGASNFPLAFSVAGGDTASAWAAGCPVIVKGHPAHPGTSELVGRAVRAAVQECGLPEGVFSLLHGATPEFGQALATHPGIRAVAFTGSRGGGLALMRAAAGRPEPIPVFAEMSSINPVFLLPRALEAGAERIAAGFVASLTGSAGQLCTNPGLLIGVDSPALDRFVDEALRALGAIAPSTMLSSGIHAAYERGVAQLSQNTAVRVLGRGQPAAGGHQCCAALMETDFDAFAAAPHDLGQEVFGASSLLVRCPDEARMRALVPLLEGQLTATLHASPEDDPALIAELMSALELKAGRLLFNGFPTGVEVCGAMVHGGPFPATSDARTTSVGLMAQQRFLRPVCYQDVPDAALPEALREANPWRVARIETH